MRMGHGAATIHLHTVTRDSVLRLSQSDDNGTFPKDFSSGERNVSSIFHT